MWNDLSTDRGMTASCRLDADHYAPRMSAIDSRRIVWASISALMLKHWGEENLNRLARAAKVGPATVVRIKGQQTSVGLEVLDKIADVFGVHTWQLLVPGMDPEKLPTLLPVTQAEREFYERMLKAAREFKGH